MDDRAPVPYPADPVYGVAAAVLDPVGVDFKAQGGVALLHEDGQPGPVAHPHEFRVVVVVAEGHARFLQPEGHGRRVHREPRETVRIVPVGSRHGPDGDMFTSPEAVFGGDFIRFLLHPLEGYVRGADLQACVPDHGAEFRGIDGTQGR